MRTLSYRPFPRGRARKSMLKVGVNIVDEAHEEELANIGFNLWISFWDQLVRGRHAILNVNIVQLHGQIRELSVVNWRRHWRI